MSMEPKQLAEKYYSKDRIKLLIRVSQGLADHAGSDHRSKKASDNIVSAQYYDKILENNPEYKSKVELDPTLDSKGFADWSGDKHRIVLKDKLTHVLAHEIGHIKARNSLKQCIANILGSASNIPAVIPYIGPYLAAPLRNPAVAIKEYAANSEGIKLLQAAGAPKEDIDKVRKDYTRRVLDALVTGR